MPLTKPEALLAANWIETHFGDKISEAVKGTPFNQNNIISIALQESAQDWLPWINEHTPEVILSCIISDPSGDQQGTVRHVWPQNLSVFKVKYPYLAAMLIEEGNRFRAMKGWTSRVWLYKAYGIFQYDIQAIDQDKSFFAEKQWYSFDECLKRLMLELNMKYHIVGDVWGSIKRYNGAGAAAVEYMQNVQHFNNWIA